MPAATVRPPPGGLKTLDLRHMTMAQLHAEAAATQTRDLFAALLPDPPGARAVAGWAHSVDQAWPGQTQQAFCVLTGHAESNCSAACNLHLHAGVPLGRIAYVTGHGPEGSEDDEEDETEEQQQQRKRQKQQQQQPRQQQRGQAGGTGAQLAEDEQLFSLLDALLAADPGSSSASGAAKGSQKQRQQAARLWAAHGLAGAPRFGGVECDPAKLWRAVQQRGGGDEVTRTSAWTSVAQDLGIDTKYQGFRNAGFYVAQWWQKFGLQAYERSRQQRSGSAAKRRSKAAAAGQEDAGPAVPG